MLVEASTRLVIDSGSAHNRIGQNMSSTDDPKNENPENPKNLVTADAGYLSRREQIPVIWTFRKIVKKHNRKWTPAAIIEELWRLWDEREDNIYLLEFQSKYYQHVERLKGKAPKYEVRSKLLFALLKRFVETHADAVPTLHPEIIRTMQQAISSASIMTPPCASESFMDGCVNGIALRKLRYTETNTTDKSSSEEGIAREKYIALYHSPNRNACRFGIVFSQDLLDLEIGVFDPFTNELKTRDRWLKSNTYRTYFFQESLPYRPSAELACTITEFYVAIGSGISAGRFPKRVTRRAVLSVSTDTTARALAEAFFRNFDK